MDHVNYFLENVHIGPGKYRARPRIVLRDGLSMSLQASSSHRCNPQSDVGPYTHVEVGYPSSDLVFVGETLAEFASPPGKVFINVPVAKVNDVIDAGGGIDCMEYPDFEDVIAIRVVLPYTVEEVNYYNRILDIRLERPMKIEHPEVVEQAENFKVG